MELKISEIEDILGIKKKVLKSDYSIKDWCFDTRKISIPNNSIFIALIGKNRDGHLFIEDAYNKGIRVYIVSEIPKKNYEDAYFILVENSLKAIQKIAEYVRTKFQKTIIGITGSNGKTIVKDWLSFLLSQKNKIYKNPRSYNSQLGVSLAMMMLEPNVDIAIFEAGISEKNEMNFLQVIINPEIGILTNIGEAHSDGFENIEEKLLEKLKLFIHSKTLIYRPEKFSSLQNSIINKHLETHSIIPITWGFESSNLYQIKLNTKARFTEIQVLKDKNKYIFSIPYTDDASIENAVHCFVCLELLNKITPEILEYFALLPSIKMRLEMIKGVNECLIINDTYNADIESVKIAISTLQNLHQFYKKTAVFSDLNLKDEEKEKTYKTINEQLLLTNFHQLIFIGKDWQQFSKKFQFSLNQNIFYFENTNDFLSKIYTLDFYKEAILIKGSREFKLENIVKALQLKHHSVVLEVNIENLKNNFNLYKSKLYKKTKMMVMVKANAYGLGSFEIAYHLQNWGVDYLGVAYTDEGVSLRRDGITKPIMVMNPDLNTIEIMYKWNLEPEVYGFSILNSIIDFCNKNNINSFPIHIKLDTGMHRLGWEQNQLSHLIKILKENPFLKIKSIYTHLASADDINKKEFTQLQVQFFDTWVYEIESKLGINIPLKHILNTAGIENFPEYQKDMVRLGIGFYGIKGSSYSDCFPKYTATLKAKISQIHHLKKVKL